MFKQDTLDKISTLEATDVIRIIEAAYKHYCSRYYDAVEAVRQLRNEDGLLSQHIPSPYSNIAPRHQHREEALDSAISNMNHTKRLADLLNYVLRDLNEVRHKQSAKDIVDFIRSRG